MKTYFDTTPLAAAPDLGFATQGLDRAALHREDSGWQEAALRRPGTRLVALCNDTPILNWDGARLDPLFDLASATALGPASDALFLGLDGDAPRFALNISRDRFDELKARDDLKLIDMRSIAMQGLLAPGVLNAVGTAKAMFLWHMRHRFCSNCGQPSVMASAGWKRKCPACGTEHFPRTDPVVIMLVTHGNSVLLGRSPGWPEGMFSVLAGFVEPGETLEAAVRREVLEEAGITCGEVGYLASQPWPFPASLMIGMRTKATSSAITIDPEELEQALWVSREDLVQVLAGLHPSIRPPRRGAIAEFLLRNWLADRLD
jgi:NAD+ diphosphatase